MRTASDILKQELDRMGADAWCGLRDGQWLPMDSPVPDYALPAWRDGDGWFVLPEDWTWDSDTAVFNRGETESLCRHDGGYYDGLWVYCDYTDFRLFDIAPGAFRAAEKMVKP